MEGCSLYSCCLRLLLIASLMASDSVRPTGLKFYRVTTNGNQPKSHHNYGSVSWFSRPNLLEM